MCRRAGAVSVPRDTTHLRDLLADLAARQETAHARLRALAQLDLDRPNLRLTLHEVLESGHRKPAIRLPAPEIASANLQDEISTV